jgi:hypothetical protein
MSITQKTLAEITGPDIWELLGTVVEPHHVVVLPAWSRADAAIAAASLANTTGGFIIVGATADSAGRLTSIDGVPAPISESELLQVAADLGPSGPQLVQARVLSEGGRQVGLLAVAESAAPPVMVETTGTLVRRDAAGLVQIRARAELDQLLQKDRRSRELAERNIEGMIGRVAFGHFNFMTVAVVAMPRFPTAAPYEWAKANLAAIAGTLPFASRWGFSPANADIAPGDIEIALPGDVTGFVRIARNGCVAVGERQNRPAQDRYLSPADFSRRLAEIAATACAPFAETRSGLIASAMFLEGVRDLRLPVEAGLTAPVAKDMVQAALPERYVDAPDEREAFARGLQVAAGEVFTADLVNGSGEAFGGPVTVSTSEARSWHGLTKRTERRLEGARGHGSGR